MMEFLSEYGLFLAKTVTLTVAIIAIVGFVLTAAMRQRQSPAESIEVKNINDHYRDMSDTLDHAMLSKPALKTRRKADKKINKAKGKALKRGDEPKRKRLFVLDFDGDIRGSEVSALREEITALLTVATTQDEVLIRLESGGGLVHAYGLAASQLARIKDRNIPLTVAVDKVAASGGYLMACVADKIIAAPFSIIGSIGVITQIPNFHRLLKKHDVDFEQVTAGEFKRTITMFGESTDKAREKLKQEVEDTHTLFKDFVKQQRPVVELSEIATGEYWLGKRAHELNLVDALGTSDDYLLNERDNADIFELHYSVKQKMLERITAMFGKLGHQGLSLNDNDRIPNLT